MVKVNVNVVIRVELKMKQQRDVEKDLYSQTEVDRLYNTIPAFGDWQLQVPRWH